MKLGLLRKNIIINDTSAISIEQLKLFCNSLESTIGLIIVDYIPLMSGEGLMKLTRQQEIEEIVSELKEFAVEQKISIIGVLPLSKYALKNVSPLWEMKQYGEVQAFADSIFFIQDLEKGIEGNYKIEFLKDRHSLTKSYLFKSCFAGFEE